MHAKQDFQEWGKVKKNSPIEIMPTGRATKLPKTMVITTEKKETQMH